MSQKPLLTIFLIVFIDLFGFGIILPLLPFIAEQYSASPFEIGLLTASYSLFQLIGAPILGRLSDRYGRKKLLIISQLGTVAGFVLLGVAGSLPILFLSRIIDGITGGNISIAQAYIADVTEKKDRAKGMGMLGAAFGLGFILGPVVGGILAKFGFAAPAYFAAGIAFASVLATWFLLKETVDITKAKHSPKTTFSFSRLSAVFKSQPIGMLTIAFFILNLAFSSMTGNFALWTQAKFSYGPTENGWLFAYVGIIAVITQMLVLPRLVKRMGEGKLLSLGTASLGIGLASIPFSRTPVFLYLSLLWIAFGNGVSNPSLLAVASESVKKEEYGGTLGFLQSAGSFGRVIGPPLGGELFEVKGKDSPFVFASLLTGVIVVMFVRFLKTNVYAIVDDRDETKAAR